MPNVLATMQHATFLTGETDKQTDTTNQERQWSTGSRRSSSALVCYQFVYQLPLRKVAV